MSSKNIFMHLLIISVLLARLSCVGQPNVVDLLDHVADHQLYPLKYNLTVRKSAWT